MSYEEQKLEYEKRCALAVSKRMGLQSKLAKQRCRVYLAKKKLRVGLYAWLRKDLTCAGVELFLARNSKGENIALARDQRIVVAWPMDKTGWREIKGFVARYL